MVHKYVYCRSHGAPHRLNRDGSCWCTAYGEGPYEEDRPLGEFETPADAAEGCRKLGLWLYLDWVAEQHRGRGEA